MKVENKETTSASGTCGFDLFIPLEFMVNFSTLKLMPESGKVVDYCLKSPGS